MQRKNKFILAALLSWQIFGCQSTPHKDDVLARVNGKNIFVSDYRRAFENLKPKDLSTTGRERSELKNLVIKNLVRRAVILSEAESRKISITESELEDGIRKYKEGYTTSTFRESLLEQMLDENEWREQIRENLLIDRMFESTAPRMDKPSLQEALRYYEQNSQAFKRNAQASALHLVVGDKSLAEELAQKIKRRPADFPALIKQFSIGPEAKEGGKITVDEGVMPEEIDRVLFQSKIGSITEIVSSPFGYHQFKILSRTPALNKDFDQVKAEIFRLLQESTRQDWLLRFEERLIRGAQIEYDRGLITRL